jgi:hypothetical protein
MSFECERVLVHVRCLIAVHLFQDEGVPARCRSHDIIGFARGIKKPKRKYGKKMGEVI